MASNNRTPASILEAPKPERAFVKGTEFNGANRKVLRSLGHVNRNPQGHVRRKANKRHWFRDFKIARAEAEKARLAAELEALDKAK